MKVIVSQEVTIDQLREKLTQQFPNYQCSMRNKQMLIVAKSSTAAVIVMVRKNNKVIINEGFGTMGGQMAFSLSMVLLGVVIPIIIYYAAFFPKQKAVKVEVADFVRAQYGGQ